MAPHASSGLADNGTHSTSAPDTAPVIIVGAGPVGLLVALRLAQGGIRSVVLEMGTSLSQLPRAIGYYGPVHDVFQEIGLYHQIAAEGMPSGGYVWRKLPTEVTSKDGTMSKQLGEIIGKNLMSPRGPDGKYAPGHYSIQLAQCRLAEIFLEEAVKTGLTEVRWGNEVIGLEQDSKGVSVTSKVGEATNTLRGQYLAACDGGRSTVRKLLGIRLSGHSWPERFLAMDVLRTAPVVPEIPVHFTVDETFWGVVTPLEHIEAGKPGLWRYSLAVPALPTDGITDTEGANGTNGTNGASVRLTDEQVVEPAYVESLLRRQMDGPLPVEHTVVRKSLYKMHQLLASTMHRGRCFLAGDSAHINNPIGGLGLCTGLLDGDALAQTLEIALEETGRREDDAALQALFTRYSTGRRWIFQNVIHPFSSANKTRLHGASAENTAREDWYFQALARGDEAELEQIHRPLYESWRTDMRKVWSDGLSGEEAKEVPVKKVAGHTLASEAGVPNDH